MADTSMIYTLPSEVPAGAVATVTSGTEDPDYPVTNLFNGNPARPAKFTSTDVTIVFEFPGVVTINIVGLINTTLDPSDTDVRWQGNLADVWTSPLVDVPVPVAARAADGFVPGAYAELTGAYQWWRLVVPTQSVNVVLGELLFYSAAHRCHWVLRSPSPTRPTSRQTVKHETAYGVQMAYDRGAGRRTKTGTVGVVSLPSVTDWFDTAQADTLPFLLVPDPGLENEAWMVRFGQPAVTPTRVAAGYWQVPLTFAELSRGVPLL